ncbi:MAG: GAF domain-containing protein [Chloroflexi bacterium]|nr:GAF domain-containing protein [Chloroflexota bacterium]
METKRDELQTLQISYEIAMSIGASLDLRQMLKVGLRAYLKKLNCVAGSVLQLVEDDDGRYQFRKSYAIPRQPERNETYRAATAVIPHSLDADQLQQFQAQLPIIAQAENGNYYHIFNLPDFGLLLLVKNKRPLDPDLVLSLKPLNQKLAAACQACLTERAWRTEAQYREIFDTLEDGYYETNLAGNITFFNKGLAQVLGYPEENLQGISYKVYADPDTQQQIFDAYSGVYRTGQSQSAFIWKHISKDGSSGYIEASISLKFDHKDKPIGFRGIMRDVTRLVESLQEEQNRTQTILEAVTTPMLIYRVTDAQLLYVNQPLAEMLHLPLADLIGNQTPNFYTSMADRQQVLARLKEQGYVTNMELPLQRGDGERFWGMITARPLIFDGESAIVATVVDVTEQRLAEESLAKRTTELETVAQVSTAVATVLDSEKLLQEVVNLVKERFDLYHTHIFLLDDVGQNLLLTSGAGEAGQQMVAEGLSIAVDQAQSLVAQAARTRQGVIVNDVLTSPGFLPNPLLPDTRAEMAVPMIVGNTLLGVLDVQADSPDYFSEEDAEIQTILATQVAIALENARSFAASEEARQQLDELARRLTREGWESYISTLEDDLFFDYGQAEINAVAPDENGAETAVSDSEALVQPLTIQGEAIGQLKLVEPQMEADDTADIVTAVAASLSAHLENLCLTEQTQTALAQTEALYQYSTRLSSAVSFHEILEAVTEPAIQRGAFCATLFIYESSEQGQPVHATIAATLDKESMASGHRLYLPEFPFSRLWFMDTQTPILISNIAESKYIDERLFSVLQEMETYALVSMPLSVGGLLVGQFVMRWREPYLFTEADQRLFDSIANQAASVVYNRMLFKQTDEALSETAALYQASADINAATTFDDIINALRHHTILGHNINNLSFNYFDRPWTENEPPEWVEVVTHWSTLPDSAVMPRYPLSAFPSAEKLLHRDAPTIIEDVLNDPRLDDNVRTLYAERFQANSTIFVPLVLGNQWVGFINAIYPQKMTFPDEELRRIIALSRQAAVAIQSIRLLEATEARARREQALREIAAKVHRSADVDVVMRTAVQEVGKALGRQAFIYMEQN